ncbi:hypothetical protein Hypma_011985 [Hypsizygus marmoreus]|uniref:Uncharacterized protein n=1 Tax=Hypsizygus marmoreus TaxID=39966 RepID=A0A369JFG7_HYPMA|nr:hypothetical protein Hypma_011985 [Hypsizygus marmoreus]
MAEILPNMGRPADVYEPLNVDHLYRDPVAPLPVYLVVWGGDRNVPPQDRHWAIVWKVGVGSTGADVHRQLEVVRELGPTGELDHLTNWGPKTRTSDSQTMTATFVPIGVFSYQQRQWLEQLASAEPVLKPNGWWNCQHWVVSILVKCIQGNLLSRPHVEAVLAKAGWTAPLMF